MRKKIISTVLVFTYVFSLAGWPVSTRADTAIVTLNSPANGATSVNIEAAFQCTATDDLGLQSMTLNYGKIVQTTKQFRENGTIINTADDAQIDANYPTTKYGAATSINIDGLTPHAHAVIKFPNIFGADISQIPLGSEITSASITVQCFNIGNTMKAYALKEDWKESEVTWNERMAGVPWSNPGADGLNSRDSQAMDWSCTTVGAKTYDMTSFVRNWSGGSANYGVVVTDTGADGIDIYSSEDATLANRPLLQVTYKTLENWGPKQTQAVSGLTATAVFQANLEDQSTYQWNCEATDIFNQKSSAPENYILNIDTLFNSPPYQPALLSPVNGSSVYTTTVPLEVAVSDPEANQMEVTFYGREQGARGENFTIIALPDSQFYTTNNLGIFNSQTQWIAGQKQARNIVAVAHEGDITNTWNDMTEWGRANTAMTMLDGIVPYALLPGNHNISDTREATYYNQIFPISRYNSLPWYGGNYPAGSNENNYLLFSAGGMEYLLISLIYCPTVDVLVWANQIIGQYPNRQVIISTHGYMGTSAQRHISISSAPQAGGCTDATANTQYIWDSLIYPNDKTFLVLNGHMHGEAQRTDLNMGGKPVYQLLADYQNAANGGDGWLRILTFKPAENKIYVETYTPYQNLYETDANSQFTLDFNMDGFSTIATVPNVVSGTNIQALWANLKTATTYEWYVSIKDTAGKITVSPVWSFVTSQGNQLPIAQAGPDQALADTDGNGLESATLDGTSSNDLDGTIVTYEWKEGLNVLATSASFTQGFTTGIHNIDLTITDDQGATANDSVIITVNPNQLPVANAGADQTISDNNGDGAELAALDGSLSADEGSIVSYEWSETGVTLGNTATLSQNFTVGIHAVALTVTDNAGAQNSDTVIVTINPNQSPVAEAGPDQLVGDNDGNGSEAVVLSGINSSDADGTIISYEWKEGGTVIGAGSTANVVLSIGIHTIELIVTDNGNAQASNLTTITVEPNILPIANAGTDQTLNDSNGDGVEAITLDGTASNDPDGAITGYQWKEGAQLLGNSANLTTNFSVGVHNIELTVTDNKGGAAIDSVIIMINANQSPVAEAGADQIVLDANGNDYETISLDGTASTDPDGTVAQYTWQEGLATLGTGAQLSSDFSVGIHIITLTVTDNGGLTNSDPVIITITPNTLPVAQAGLDQTINDSNGDGTESVSLDGSNSFDADGTIVAYEWKEGSTVLAATQAFTQNFNVGVHNLILTVTDNYGAQASDAVVVTINANQLPIASAGADQSVTDTNDDGLELITFNGLASSDPDGNIISYQWTEGAQVLGSGATLSVSLPVGTHEITLTITDNGGATNSDAVAITINSGRVTRTLAIASGYNSKTRTSIDPALVQTSNNQRQRIDKTKYVSFKFENANIPSGAIINSVTVYVEHYENSGFRAGDLQWNIGTGWPNASTIWGTYSSVPIKTTDTLQPWDVTGFANSPSKVNSMELRVLNNSRNYNANADYIYAVIDYSL